MLGWVWEQSSRTLPPLVSQNKSSLIDITDHDYTSRNQSCHGLNTSWWTHSLIINTLVYITLHRQFDKSKQDTNTRHYTDLHCWYLYFFLSLYSDTYLSMRSCLSLSSCLSRSMRSFSIRSILSLSMRSLSIISRSLENKCPNKSSLFLGSRYWGGMGIEG